MAIRKNNSKESGSSGKSGGSSKSFLNRLRRLRNIMFLFLAFLLGGVVFNLDRAGELGIALLRVKSFIPYPFSKWLPGAGAADGAPVPEQTVEGRVIEVADGDTATVFDEKNNLKYRVRFFGIDAPEKAMKFGSSARSALQDKILGKNVTVKVINTDIYHRAVGKVLLGTRYINLEMVSDGFAWYYPDYAAGEYDLAAAEREARSRKRGLWQEKNPTPPWEYRKSKK